MSWEQKLLVLRCSLPETDLTDTVRGIWHDGQ